MKFSPPAYTGLPPAEKAFRFAGVQALEGTEVQFRIRSNRPLGPGSFTAQLGEAEPALAWMEKSLGQDYGDAIHAMAIWHLQGQLVDKDPQRALKILRFRAPGASPDA